MWCLPGCVVCGVCLGVGYVVSAWVWGMLWLPAPKPAPVLAVAGGYLKRGDGQVRWAPSATCVCLGQAPLASLPRLVDEGSSPTLVIRSYVGFRDRAR
jgi:hypothetical protein